MKNARPQTAESSALDKCNSSSPRIGQGPPACWPRCPLDGLPAMSYQIIAHLRYYKISRSDPNWNHLPGSERYGVLTCAIQAECRPKSYEPHAQFLRVSRTLKTGYVIGNAYPYDNLEFAKRRLEQHRNVVRFTNLSGLTPSRQWRREREVRDMVCIDPWDHATVWHDGNRHLVLTNEPYSSQEFPAWCTASGWRCVPLPAYIGTYWPGVTFCFLAAPLESTADLVATAQRTIAGWSV